MRGVDAMGVSLPLGCMSRSVVLRQTPRCEHCQLTPRWCICEGQQPIRSQLKVGVLMHFMESYRPSSTGHLIQRVLPDSKQHIFRKDRPLAREDLVESNRELWILHPQGEPMPVARAVTDIQMLLLDGTWVQATEMAHRVGPWGRRVSLPMTGESRYWLRAQAGPGRFSTVEALLFLLESLGLEKEHAQLRVQFELHVYASLRARGHRELADKYLAGSPLRAALPDFLAKLEAKRPNPA
jgi:DTW domain-containing protein YfiP